MSHVSSLEDERFIRERVETRRPEIGRIADDKIGANLIRKKYEEIRFNNAAAAATPSACAERHRCRTQRCCAQERTTRNFSHSLLYSPRRELSRWAAPEINESELLTAAVGDQS